MNKIKFYLLGYLSILISGFLSAQNGLNFSSSGTADYIQTTYGGVFGTTNRTFEAWVFINSAPPANLAISDYGLNAVGSRNTFVINSNLGLGYLSGGTNANISSSVNVVPLGQWVHVAFVLDNAVGYLYVNGAQVGTGSLSTVNTPSGNLDMRIGERVSGGTIPFNGIIDEVRIWSVARTPQELMANMNTELCGNPPGLEAYYKLNEGTAGGNNAGITTAVDEVAGANGTLLNFGLSGTTSNWVAGASLTTASTVNNLTLNECAGFSITVGSSTYSATGNYSDTLVGASANGCDSIVNTDLTIAAAIDTSVTLDTLTIFANQVGATYQWLDCNNAFAPISGETNQSFTATSTGSYAVEITVGNCVDTSACRQLTVSNIGLSEFGPEMVSIFPNPAKDVVQVNFGTSLNALHYTLTTIDGRVVEEKAVFAVESLSIDLSKQAKGVYFLKLNDYVYRVVRE